MSFEESIKKGTFFGFIPKRLEIEGRPEFGIFPFNILFVNWVARGEKKIIASAIYEPDLSSFKQESGKYKMIYHNAYGGKSWIEIEFDLSAKSYLGKKFVEGDEVGMASGQVWNMFFAHFTALGLTEAEWCKFEQA